MEVAKQKLSDRKGHLFGGNSTRSQTSSAAGHESQFRPALDHETQPCPAGPDRAAGSSPAAARVESIRETDQVLGITQALDAGIGPIKYRGRGLTGGELVVSMATALLADEDFLVGSDR